MSQDHQDPIPQFIDKRRGFRLTTVLLIIAGTGGELVKVAFTKGQMVKEGDLLAEIDPRPFQVLLQQAEGQLMRDEAILKNAEISALSY